MFDALHNPPDKVALKFGERALTYEQLAVATERLAGALKGVGRAAIWAEPSVETCIGVLGALRAGVAAVPLNPGSGPRELEHIVKDCAPDVMIAPSGAGLPTELNGLKRIWPEAGGGGVLEEFPPRAPAMILYTSGTTGPPKGVVLSRRAITSNLDALATAWDWTEQDILTHGLPLFHVHGLVLGVLGPLRRGGALHHIGRFSPEAICRELADEATLMFGVPTMYYRLAEAVERDADLAEAVARARALVSGSAPLPVRDHRRIADATGQRIVERYGLTETLMNCAVWTSGDRRPGYVGPPLPGIELKLVDDGGATVEAHDDETMGEVAVRGPNLFTEYLNRPDATAEAVRDGWFYTGDLATRSEDGYIRMVGRRSTDLIKSGGYRIGAGEVEAALLEHEAVAMAAVIGELDEDLGERVVAFVVRRPEETVSEQELVAHVGDLLSTHKRPREVRFVEDLPRNEMGKVRKGDLKGS